MENNELGYVWKPIEDLPSEWKDLTNPELISLSRVWQQHHAQLKESRSVSEFNERLLREWSIETGILERLYTIDRGTTQLLIEQGIDSALIQHGTTDRTPDEIVRMIQDHRNGLDSIRYLVENGLPITIGYIHQLHQVMTNSQSYLDGIDQFGNTVRRPLRKGVWKQLPNNPTRRDGLIHEYCPPVQVGSEIDMLVELHAMHSALNVPADVEAAWLHHRFAQIHPYEDGNGRVARALATIVFVRAGWFPLVINRDQRSEYIASLEAADNGDIRLLVSLFGRNAKRAFARALELSEDVLRGDDKALPAVLDDIFDVYRARRRSMEEAYLGVERVASSLVDYTASRLENVASEMRLRFAAEYRNTPTFGVSRSSDANRHYYSYQIVAVAKDLEYWANISKTRFWVRLYIYDAYTKLRTHIVFSFHYLGKTNRGVMTCTGFVYFPESKPGIPDEIDGEEDTESTFIESHRICEEPFYFSYNDETRVEELAQDFNTWLQNSINIGLAEWVRRS